MVEIEFPKEFRTGDVYSMIVFDLDYEDLEYGYRFEGPWDQDSGQRFDHTKILFDPYSKVLGGRNVWREETDPSDIYHYRSRLIFDDFDWENDHALETPLQDLVISAPLLQRDGSGDVCRVTGKNSIPEGIGHQLR